MNRKISNSTRPQLKCRKQHFVLLTWAFLSVKSIWTKRLNYFYCLDFKGATPSLELQGRCTKRCRWGKKALSALVWTDKILFFLCGPWSWNTGSKEGAKIHLQSQSRAVFLRAHVQQWLNVCKNTCLSYVLLNFITRCSCFGTLTGTRKFTNKLLLPWGFSPHHCLSFVFYLFGILNPCD